jgi:hypothetical protein
MAGSGQRHGTSWKCELQRVKHVVGRVASARLVTAALGTTSNVSAEGRWRRLRARGWVSSSAVFFVGRPRGTFTPPHGADGGPRPPARPGASAERLGAAESCRTRRGSKPAPCGRCADAAELWPARRPRAAHGVMHERSAPSAAAGCRGRGQALHEDYCSSQVALLTPRGWQSATKQMLARKGGCQACGGGETRRGARAVGRAAAEEAARRGITARQTSAARRQPLQGRASSASAPAAAACRGGCEGEEQQRR